MKAAIKRILWMILSGALVIFIGTLVAHYMVVLTFGLNMPYESAYPQYATYYAILYLAAVVFVCTSRILHFLASGHTNHDKSNDS